MTNTARSCVIVLGMHRSGTSAVAGVLSTIGVDFGNDLLLADSDNPRGYFENKNIVHIQNSLLNQAGYSWSSPVDKDESIILPDVNVYEKFKSIIINDYSTSSTLFGFKDPRTSMFLSGWLKVLESLNVEPKFVICFRSPHSVISSLNRRDKINPLHAELLWLLEYSRIVSRLDEYKHVLVNYDDFINHPVNIINKMNITLDLGLHCDNAMLKIVESFVEKNLDHGAEAGNLKTYTENIWNVLKNKCADQRGILTYEDRNNVLTHYEDIKNDKDWNLMLRYPDIVRRWSAKLYYQGVRSTEDDLRCVNSTLFWSPHKFIKLRFLPGQVNAKQFVLELLEYMGEYTVSRICFYECANENGLLVDYKGEQLHNITEVWGDGFLEQSPSGIHVVQYGTCCQVNLNVEQELLKKIKIIDVTLQVESLYLSESAKKVFFLPQEIDRLKNSRSWRWTAWLRKISSYFNNKKQEEL